MSREGNEGETCKDECEKENYFFHIRIIYQLRN